jgi:MerR family transcriptional regulator, mercuric resistance operon regulatory protein
MKIRNLAREAGVSVETVRYYQRIKLLRIPPRGAGPREYSEVDLRRLRFVRRAQTLGFTLREVAALLELPAAECENVERVARERRAAIVEKIESLREIEEVLAAVIERCMRRAPHEGCPIVETLAAS